MRRWSGGIVEHSFFWVPEVMKRKMVVEIFIDYHKTLYVPTTINELLLCQNRIHFLYTAQFEKPKKDVAYGLSQNILR